MKPAPEGMLRNAAGHYVEIEMIDQLELEQNKVVTDWMEKAAAMQRQMREFKAESLAAIDKYLRLSARKSKAGAPDQPAIGTIYSFDGQMKIEVTRQKRVEYDNRINEARQHLKAAIDEMGESASPEFRAFVAELLDLGEDDSVKPSKIAQLKRYKLGNTHIQAAISLLNKASRTILAGRYVRYYQQDDNGKFQPISLDMAGL